MSDVEGEERAMATGSIIEVDPSTLTIAPNVRADVKLDKEFLASIKENGILQPPMVVKGDGDGYDVVLGQRRTLAAAQAGLKSIPVYLVEKNEADAARIIDQLTENDQRQQLSDVERLGGYRELALIGITPAQIAKRTSQPRKTVDAALAVADSEVATNALTSFQITLDQAAEIVEFADDKAAVKRLTEAAESDPGRLPHIVKDLREKRVLAQSRAEIEADIVKEGVELLPYTEWSGQSVDGFTTMSRLGSPKDATEELQRDEVKDKKMLGARAIRSYAGAAYVIEKQYLVRDGHPFEQKGYKRPEYVLTPEQEAAEAAREGERRQREKRQAASRAASDVRHAWIKTELLQRAKLPDFIPFVADQMTRSMLGSGYDGVHPLVWELLSIITPTEDDLEAPEEDDFLRDQLAATPALAAKWVLVAAIASAEIEFDGWRGPEPEEVAPYLLRLVEWGYGLSEYEQGVVDAAKEPEAA